MKPQRNVGANTTRKGASSPSSSSGGRKSSGTNSASPPQSKQWAEENSHGFAGNTVGESSHSPVVEKSDGPQRSSQSPASSSRTRDFWETVLGPSPSDTDLLGNTNPSPHDTNDTKDKTDKPYACSTCPKRFKKRCNLLTHVSNVHDKIRPFQCSICYRKFARKSNCVKHVSFACDCLQG